MACNGRNRKTFRFEITRDGTGTLTNSNELLNTKERAEEYAKAMFIVHAFITSVITFTTYLTDINLNDIVKIRGLNYFVIGITTNVDNVKIQSSITCERYD